MDMPIRYDRMCREELKCDNYIEWEQEVWIGNSHSLIVCVSCVLVGHSYNIEEYPDDCPHKQELKEFKEQEEKRRMWRKLNAVNV